MLMLSGANQLFSVNVDREELYDLYLESFPEGKNEVFRERQEFDCSACRHFIKSFGNVVTLKDQNVTTIWDFDSGDPTYQEVINQLAIFVRGVAIGGSGISDVFLTDKAVFGVDKNTETTDDGRTLTWHHLYCELPTDHVTKSLDTLDTLRGKYRDTCNVFKRSLEEITEDSVLTVLELISQGSLYRGEEWSPVLKQFLNYLKEYAKVSQNLRKIYCWEKSVRVGDVAGRIRNHSIGVLLTDISTGVDLDEAVRKYEAIVAPANYKRPKAIYTQKMIEAAQKEILSLGYGDSLERRFATLDDITINNILFFNKDAAKRIAGNVFEQMSNDLPVNPKTFAKIEEVPIGAFLADVLPNVKSMEVLLEGRHSGNLVSLVAPQTGV